MEKQKLKTMENKIAISVDQTPEFIDAQEKQEQLVKENPFIEVKDSASYEQAKKHRTALVKGRTTIEKGDKAIASKLREFRENVKNLANSLVFITAKAEEKQKAEITRYENIKAEEKAKKEREKKEQMEAWSKKANDILSYSFSILNSESIEEAENIIQQVHDINVNEGDFGAYELIATQNKGKVLEQAQTIIERLKNEKKLADELAEQQKVIEKQKLDIARQSYMACFSGKAPDNVPDENLTADEINKLISIDRNKQATIPDDIKENPLTPDEAFETPSIEKQAEKIGNPVPFSETNEDDVIKRWKIQIEEVIKNKPQTASYDAIIGQAVHDLKLIINSLNDLLKNDTRNN